MPWNNSSDGKANITNGFLTSAPANVNSFGGVNLGTSTYQPISYSLIDRPSCSTSSALDLKVSYGGQTEMIRHIDGTPKIK